MHQLGFYFVTAEGMECVKRECNDVVLEPECGCAETRSRSPDLLCQWASGVLLSKSGDPTGGVRLSMAPRLLQQRLLS